MQFLENDDLGKLILRLTLGVLLLFHGLSKLLGDGGTLSWIAQQLEGMGIPGVVAYGVYIGEIIAPIMLILGYQSRVAGLIVVGNMLFAFAIAHMSQLISLSSSGGWALELQGFYLATGLAVVFLGSGRFAVQED
ncbi:DoxX family protein [Cobetia crustatorum]|uniref:DoxX family protein n=1 Tax=Cobetia crustatorum TaxID=553385 RepID=A0A558HH03_9GAMM|nr:DoxX family protein [Cobetia crustatorum]TVU68412.1 DoxX family protein [Cobetia crustatorum]